MSRLEGNGRIERSRILKMEYLRLKIIKTGILLNSFKKNFFTFVKKIKKLNVPFSTVLHSENSWEQTEI